ncbi:DUF4440 domain-containing protein [Siminovitchia terrae]|uniref:DUF4440 domain-containing protein n=1 Tax=Siminovitchia terrae TaxID=1914933 RepID=UPI0028A95AB8|nr:DUF4440 domain-containing protein [Siminovitchia terrae]
MKHIFQLEEQLGSQSYDDLDDLLADNYLEFGSTGKIYDKKAQLDRSESNPSVQFTVTDFDIQCLAADVVLATYWTHKHNDGEKLHLGI